MERHIQDIGACSDRSSQLSAPMFSRSHSQNTSSYCKIHNNEASWKYSSAGVPGALQDSTLNFVTPDSKQDLIGEMQPEINISGKQKLAHVGPLKLIPVTSQFPSSIYSFSRGLSIQLKFLAVFFILGLVQANEPMVYQQKNLSVSPKAFPSNNESSPYHGLMTSSTRANFSKLRILVSPFAALFLLWYFLQSCRMILRSAQIMMRELPNNITQLVEMEYLSEKMKKELHYHVDVLVVRLTALSHQEILQTLIDINGPDPAYGVMPKDVLVLKVGDLFNQDMKEAVTRALDARSLPGFEKLTVSKVKPIWEDYIKYVVAARNNFTADSAICKNKRYAKTLDDSMSWYEVWFYYCCDWFHCLKEASREQWGIHPIKIAIRVFQYSSLLSGGVTWLWNLAR
ncbi:hypothetical protein JCM33374_g6495 [Metschnikowia sp. JCM 33374]|nr:hypothetical protein JCM33374_g6495 [Metschnikowia sp. JCM 33374]